MRRRKEIFDDEKTFGTPARPVLRIPSNADEKETIITLDASFEKKLESMRISDPYINTTIDGRYLLHERIGEGGMGAVYRATHVLMNKVVAIKMINAELTHLPQIVGRFEREARSASRLSHPNCITVTDFGRTEDGNLFLVMELLEGESLQDILSREGTISPYRAIDITKQILSGLSHAHEAGIVHRDLKPSNVMIVQTKDRTDFAKVFDFGIAKIAEDSGADHKLTQQGMIVGTPAYLSPEQALGEEADNRSDLYAVGVMLFEMLTGDVPYTGKVAMDVVTAHISADIPTLDPRRQYPVGLRRIMEQSMAKKPGERFQTAGEFLQAMDALDLFKMEYGKKRYTGGRASARVFFLLLIGAAATGGVFYLRQYFEKAQVQELNTKEDVSPKAPEKDPPPSLQVEEKPVADLLKEAEEKIRLGIPTEAAATLKKALAIKPDEPAVRLLLGHALFLSGKREEAMPEYEQALGARPELTVDKRLWTHLEDALKFPATAEKSAALLAKFGGDRGIGLLRERAASPLAERDERSAARRALIAVERVDDVDWLATLTADFNDFKACKKRSAIVIQMEKTGDPRFLPLLEAQRPWTKINSCIKIDVERAIDTLKKYADEQKEAAPSGTPPGGAAQ
jgi:serine/threonine protein kinase